MEKISFLGPRGTFSHEAASTISDNLISYCSITDVMGSVDSGESLKAVVPIENSIEGPVNLTVDSLVHDFDLKICGEIIIPISHNLLVNSGTSLDEVKDVYSHSQALNQCRYFIQDHDMLAHYTLSTAEAARKVSESGKGGAIGNLKAAELYGLEVLASNIQETSNNQTRFIIVSKEDFDESEDNSYCCSASKVSDCCCGDIESDEEYKTSIAFSLFEDNPGGLYNILGIFAKYNINLNKIESRPSREGLGKYIFFIDFEYKKNNKEIPSILDNLKSETSFFKHLGSYPKFK